MVDSPGGTIQMSGNHVMCIYGTHEGQLVHALHFLKEGLHNNETCVLVTNYLSEDRIQGIFRDVWLTLYPESHRSFDDVMIISASDWFFGNKEGTKIDTDEVFKSYSNLSEKAVQNGRTRLRAFVDMSLFFKHQLVQDLIECESRFKRIPTFPLKLICAYLESDISSLSSSSYENLQEDHRHVYLIPD